MSQDWSDLDHKIYTMYAVLIPQNWGLGKEAKDSSP
jgi:hypothetical protein